MLDNKAQAKRRVLMLNALTTFAQDYTTTYAPTYTTDSNSGFSPVILIFYLLIWAICGFLLMKIFIKAKAEPTWAAYVPIYNNLKMLQIVGRPWWWILLLMIPLVNIVFGILVLNDLSKSFGHGVGFTLLLIFLPLVGLIILAFNEDKYVGPAGLGHDSVGGPTAPSGPITPAA